MQNGLGGAEQLVVPSHAFAMRFLRTPSLELWFLRPLHYAGYRGGWGGGGEPPSRTPTARVADVAAGSQNVYCFGFRV